MSEIQCGQGPALAVRELTERWDPTGLVLWPFASGKLPGSQIHPGTLYRLAVLDILSVVRSVAFRI